MSFKPFNSVAQNDRWQFYCITFYLYSNRHQAGRGVRWPIMSWTQTRQRLQFPHQIKSRSCGYPHGGWRKREWSEKRGRELTTTGCFWCERSVLVSMPMNVWKLSLERSWFMPKSHHFHRHGLGIYCTSCARGLYFKTFHNFINYLVCFGTDNPKTKSCKKNIYFKNDWNIPLTR